MKGKYTQRRGRTANEPVTGVVMPREEARAAVRALVDSAAPQKTWTERANEWLEKQPVNTVLTSDEVITAVGLPHVLTGANKNNEVGNLFRQAARRGLLRKAGTYVPSTRKSNHGAVIAVWLRTDKEAKEA